MSWTLLQTVLFADDYWSIGPAMSQVRINHTVTLLNDGRILATGGGSQFGSTPTAELYDPIERLWTSTTSMSSGRYDHTATLLLDGRVLVVAADGAEIFDPSTETWSTPSQPTIARRRHTANLLANGEVLIVGGFDGSAAVSSAERYDPLTDSWSAAGDLGLPRLGHASVLVGNGFIFIHGGQDEDDDSSATVYDSTQYFDPDTNSWSPSSSSGIPRSNPSATLVDADRIVVSGGQTGGVSIASTQVFEWVSGSWREVDTTVQSFRQMLLPSGKLLSSSGDLFDPSTESWSAGPGQTTDATSATWILLSDGRAMRAGGQNNSLELFTSEELVLQRDFLAQNHALGGAALLEDGRVLIVGGDHYDFNPTVAEIFDPTTSTSEETDPFWPMLDPSFGYLRTTVLRNDRVLITGAFGGGAYYTTARLFDGNTESWSDAAPMQEERSRHTQTRLPNGLVLVCGGDGLSSSWLSSCETWDPQVDQWTFVAPMAIGRQQHAATLLYDGRVLVTGGVATGVSAEIYDPLSDTWTSAQQMNLARSYHQLTTLRDGRVLAVGGWHGSASNPYAELWDPRTGRWQLVPGALQQNRDTHVQHLLFDGRVLVARGLQLNPSDTIEVFDPIANSWRTVGVSNVDSGWGFPSVLLDDGSIFIADGDAEIFSSSGWERLDLSSAAAQRKPIIDEQLTTPVFRHGQSATVAGSLFHSDSEGSHGSTGSANQTTPQVLMRSMASGLIRQLQPDLRSTVWDDPAAGQSNWTKTTTLSFSRLPDLEPGRYQLTVVAGGVSSEAHQVEVACGLVVEDPDDVIGSIGGEVTFNASTQGGRAFQWQRCDLDACGDGNWIDIAGATGPSHTVSGLTAADVGAKIRVQVRGSCGLRPESCALLPSTHCAASGAATIQIDDSTKPTVEVLSPSGGEYWPVESSQTISWSAVDDIRLCRVRVSLWSSDDGGQSWTERSGGGLPQDIGPQGACVFPGVTQSTATYQVPLTPPSGRDGSLYQVRVWAVDHAGNGKVARSANPFYIVRPDPESGATIILANTGRMGLAAADKADLDLKLAELAVDPNVQGEVIDLGGITQLDALYAAWDAAPGDRDLANGLLFGPDGVHEYLRTQVFPVFTRAEHLVIVGGDDVIPFARIEDRGILLTEASYPAGGALRPDGTTVGMALAGGDFLSDDPLAVRAELNLSSLDDTVLVPDLKVGRLVEGPAEIIATISTFISSDGVVDLTALDPASGAKVMVTGYDFLLDVGEVIRQSWKNALGVDPDDDAATAPVNGVLVDPGWGHLTPTDRADELESQLAAGYRVMSLSGHATHHELGVPGDNPFDITGLASSRLAGMDMTGSVLYSVGCHSGLSVPDGNTADNPQDLPQTMLGNRALAHLGNTGYGWGLLHGIGYGERVVQIFSEELISGGLTEVGEAVRRSKQRYLLESPNLDAYDHKSLMQWSLFGLPMTQVRTGTTSKVQTSNDLGDVKVEHYEDRAPRALPPFMTRIESSFDLSADGIYTKRDAFGVELTDVDPCPIEGCYYTLNTLVDRGTGQGDLPLEPYLIYDSRLSGTSIHGLLWQGGEYREEEDWIPVFGQLVSNDPAGVGSEHGSTPRRIMMKPRVRLIAVTEDETQQCAASDLEISSLVLMTGEAAQPQGSSDFSLHRTYERLDVEMLYFNDSQTTSNNCDRSGPLISAGPFHAQVPGGLQLSVAVEDQAGVWRVVVVYNDASVDAQNKGAWLPLELSDAGTTSDGRQLFTGFLDTTGMSELAYVVQAVDYRGNVGWADFVTVELPSSGVDPDLPDLHELSIGCGVTDGDGDGAPDACDVCPVIWDASQTDTDSDGVGDACDNCQSTWNADQLDSNTNGIGDACEACTDLVIANQTVTGLESYATCGTATLGPALTVESGGRLEVQTGEATRLVNGFRVEPGGEIALR